MVEQKLAGAIVLNLEPDGKNTPTLHIWKLICYSHATQDHVSYHSN